MYVSCHDDCWWPMLFLWQLVLMNQTWGTKEPSTVKKKQMCRELWKEIEEIYLKYWAIFCQSNILTSWNTKLEEGTDCAITRLEKIKKRGAGGLVSTASLQRQMYDSANMAPMPALNFGNNLLREKQRIWKQFVNVQPSFPFSSNKSYSNYWPFPALEWHFQAFWDATAALKRNLLILVLV